MEIAVYVDAQDELVSLYEPGWFCIYQGSGSDWTCVQEVPFAVDDSTTLPAVKAALVSAVEQFDCCEVLLSGSVKGFIYAFLQEELGFRIWKSDGPRIEQLAGVEQRERERAELARNAPKCGPAAAGCASGGCCGGRARRGPARPCGG